MSNPHNAAQPTIYATRSLILAADDIEYKDVAVAEWGCTVRVRSISAAERERLMKSSMVVEGKGRNAVQRFNMPMFRVKLAALAMVDRDGSRLFSEDDVAELGRKNARAMERVSDAALDLCGIVDDADAEDDDVGKGGSPMILNGGSDTTSVSPSAA